MNTKVLIFVILGVALIGVGVWKSGVFKAEEKSMQEDIKIEASTGEPEATSSESSPSSDSVDAGDSMDSGDSMDKEEPVTKIMIEGDEFSFSPTNISIARGSKVELTFKNIGRAPHNYTVTELGLATKTIGGGKTDVVTLTAPDSPGTISYTSFCSIPGHREAGMVGVIEIK